VIQCVAFRNRSNLATTRCISSLSTQSNVHSDCSVLLSFTRTVHAAVAECDVWLENQTLAGSTIEVISAQDRELCATLCQLTATCSAVTYTPLNASCQLKAMHVGALSAPLRGHASKRLCIIQQVCFSVWLSVLDTDDPRSIHHCA
jgi:hypothetical protein